MIVEKQGFLDFLGQKAARFAIPAYQRIYSWNEGQCEELWLDILRSGRSGKSHFIGTVLYTRENADTGETVFSVIDGQQRMTSVSLILLALSRYLESGNAKREDGICKEAEGALDVPIDPGYLQSRYLWTVVEGEKTPRFIPSSHDREAYMLELEGIKPSSETAIDRNLAFFESRMASAVFDAKALVDGLENLTVIAVEVDEPEMAQSIFEGINSKGMPLNVADMIRNYLLLAEEHDEQTRMYEEYWKPSQEMFAPDPGSLRLNTGIKSWISIRLRGAKILSPDLVYASFKKYVEDVYEGDKEPILRELRGFCLMWAENYRYHGTKKYKSGSDWSELGAPALTAGFKLKKADNEEYAERVRQELKNIDSRW